jgi:hypothetical protein
LRLLGLAMLALALLIAARRTPPPAAATPTVPPTTVTTLRPPAYTPVPAGNPPTPTRQAAPGQ